MVTDSPNQRTIKHNDLTKSRAAVLQLRVLKVTYKGGKFAI